MSFHLPYHARTDGIDITATASMNDTKKYHFNDGDKNEISFLDEIKVKYIQQEILIIARGNCCQNCKLTK
jgi:hypothetical protein